jgi:nucleoside-triphosphatase THEP1
MSRVPVAAIVCAERHVGDALLADLAFALRRQGWKVSGLVQQYRGTHPKESARLVDLDSGACFPLFQNLGPGSESCCIDTNSLAAASAVLRRALHDGADLVIANRFGGLEAAGEGFAAEMLALMSEGIPLVAVVGNAWLGAWRHFTGGAGTELLPEMGCLEAWFAGVAGQRGRWELREGR